MRQVFPPSPPSGRDFEIYRRVVVQNCSTRVAAVEVGVSQTRVCQIIDRVQQFLDTIPGDPKDPARGNRLAVAEQIAAERLSYYVSLALKGFEESRGGVTTIREVPDGAGPPKPLRTTKQELGDPRYLMTASRIAKLAGTLPMSTLGSYVAYEDEESTAEGVTVVAVDDEEREVVQLVESPLVEGCSVDGPKEEVTANGPAVDAAASAEPHEVCASTDSADANHNFDTSRPVQDSDTIPKQPRAGKLTKQQRKERQKMLQQKLREHRECAACKS